jgi:hypothetical protein
MIFQIEQVYQNKYDGNGKIQENILQEIIPVEVPDPFCNHNIAEKVYGKEIYFGVRLPVEDGQFFVWRVPVNTEAENHTKEVGNQRKGKFIFLRKARKGNPQEYGKCRQDQPKFQQQILYFLFKCQPDSQKQKQVIDKELQRRINIIR